MKSKMDQVEESKYQRSFRQHEDHRSSCHIIFFQCHLRYPKPDRYLLWGPLLPERFLVLSQQSDRPSLPMLSPTIQRVLRRQVQIRS